MACIIKLPGDTKGVISFTSQEREKLIMTSSENISLINKIRKNWVIGQHHNWQPCNYDPFFDFSFALSNDLLNNGNLIEMDCCNFSPNYFENIDNKHQKFWDVLYVCRAVEFKRVPVFFDTIRKIYDKGYKYKVLLICSLPQEDRSPSNFFEMYLEKFSRKEREMFTVIAPEFDYPFTYSRETLSFFYKSSKVFLHTTDYEKHSRVACYAWSCGVPVIASPSVGDVLNSSTRKKPFYYEVKSYDDFVDKTIEAVENHNSELDMMPVVEQFCETYSVKKLVSELENFFSSKLNLDFKPEFLITKDLDFRLGRHHQISLGSNCVDMKFKDLLLLLNDNGKVDSLKQFINSEDFEIEIARHL
jgi:glycosyltransferase involved in cell wall biosynthesis